MASSAAIDYGDSALRQGSAAVGLFYEQWRLGGEQRGESDADEIGSGAAGRDASMSARCPTGKGFGATGNGQPRTKS